MRKIAILGSTGSIGTQALDVIRKNRDIFEVTVLTAGFNIELITEQINEFNPQIAVVAEERDAVELRKKFKNLDVLWGLEGLILAAKEAESNIVLNALVGMMGLMPTYYAIKAGKDIALANKETLVAGGAIIMEAVKEYGVQMIPVDSEHSAIFQCLQGNKKQELERIILTASGGPFRGFSIEKLKNVGVEDALNHPNWSMGNKITIDSATMMNKGLEVIEARWLFDIPVHKIDVIIHPQSIVHSMVEYVDRSIIAQLGRPDMRIPIQYAFSYPKRIKNDSTSLDFSKLGELTFEKPDTKVFKCLELAYEAIDKGDSYPVVLNAANEELVQLFLKRKVNFLDIQNNINRIIDEHVPISNPNLESIIHIDRQIREKVLQKCL